jgi:hypothetical protein
MHHEKTPKFVIASAVAGAAAVILIAFATVQFVTSRAEATPAIGQGSHAQPVTPAGRRAKMT